VRLIEAADGRLARVRLPGGLIGAAGLRAAFELAAEFGDGRLELTSRGNLQLRGLAAGVEAEIRDRLAAAGLWPSVTHDLVRNVLASPLAGLDAPVDLVPVVRRLDEVLRADERLADLSGRFLFAIDDGRGDVAALGADVLAVLGAEHAWVEGRRLAAHDVVATMIETAHAFLDERARQRSAAWRVDELDDGRRRLRERVGGDGGAPPIGSRPANPIGLVAQLNGRTALVVAPALGRLDGRQADWLAAQLGGQPARVTPWRSVVLPELTDAEATRAQAEDLGFATSADAPSFGVTACAGQPRCAQALADVQSDALASLGRWPGRSVHWSACARRCGRPRDVEVDVVASETGYVETGSGIAGG